jgi:hypothetical protein
MDDNERKKRRFLRNLKLGHRKTVSEKVIASYNWTKDELVLLQPFINHTKTMESSNVSISNNVFTKSEAFALLDKVVENEITLKNYKSRVNALMALLEIQNEQFSDIFLDTEHLIESVIKKYKDPTSYLAFMLYILSKNQKLLDIPPKNTFDLIKTKFEKYKNIQTVKQLEDRREDFTYEKIYKSIFDTEAILCKKEYASHKHLISVMYTHALYNENNIIHINPRNYFIKILLVDKDDDMNDVANFYNTSTGRLLMNKYKTSGIYKPYDVYLTNQVKEVINKSLINKPRAYLIEKIDGGLYAPNSLSEVIKRIFKYTIDDIRKSIESYEINVKKTNRVHLADVSKHSVMTQEISYLAQT